MRQKFTNDTLPLLQQETLQQQEVQHHFDETAKKVQEGEEEEEVMGGGGQVGGQGKSNAKVRASYEYSIIWILPLTIYTTGQMLTLTTPLRQTKKVANARFSRHIISTYHFLYFEEIP